MRTRPFVTEVETFPLEVELEDGGYGSARARVAARVATLVKITTSDGVSGWGEAFGPPRQVAPFLADIAREVVGTPVDVRETRTLDMVSQGYHHLSWGLPVAAASGIDIALWDAYARTFGVPASHLLGGALHTTVHAYASSGYVTRDQDLGRFRDTMAKHAAEGFTAVKIKLGIAPRDDRARTEAAREAMGGDGVVIVDYNGNATAATLVRSVDGIRDLDPYWVEEPVGPDDLAGWRAVRGVGVPLSAGEALYTRYGFRDPIAERRIDIVQPDLTKCGGFSEGQVIRQLAAAWNLQLSPHCWGTGVAQAATLQFLAATPTVPFGMAGEPPLFFEFDRGHNPLREGVLVDPVAARGGVVAIPDGPGLGVTIDEEWVRGHAMKEHGVRLRAHATSSTRR
ncbi:MULTISPECIES: mandelate racemase/muconate lactonizing enzyme family protein [Prauserella salsuginis group]|uniref:Mandelate racemase/muconate lactonizing enzyme family protein n=1 Tax=Prauserella salsuginis TaxID=387889 RepID=A0ABW6G0W9_9PSEU|nr:MULTISPECIES: mandelate racemase/muconate lactonizing enzyme family protein [Prauserella salsuginis group]MCR3721998.1 D-galactarolactone cycloisomerase [Prauserella flava]MCR3736004.1 D-galactarolactone cycloisomerase [Prauserella salsuginis]